MQQAAATAGVLAAAVRAAYTAPGGFAKLELGVVHAFAERLRAGGKLSLVIDYDLTVSAGGGWECHHLLADSPAMPAPFRGELKHLFAACERSHPDHDALLGPADAPGRRHAFWRCFNRIAAAHGITIADLNAAVAGAKASGGGAALLRPGWRELLSLCETGGVPVMILSAGVTQIITAAHHADGIHGVGLPPASAVVSSELQFDADGACTGVEPSNPPCSRHGKLQQLAARGLALGLSERSCVIVVGDKPVDATMITGYPELVEGVAGGPGPPTVISFGFHNHREPGDAEQLPDFLEAFDVLPAGDASGASFDHITAFVRACLEPDSWL